MSEFTDLVLSDATEKMDKAVVHARSDFAKVRGGRASPDLVEKLRVEAYGSDMAVLELATVSVPEARLVLVTPHDPANLEAIDRSIRSSDLGVSPSNDGRVLRINFPALTEERRKELVKVVRKMAEDGRIALRNLRREGRKELEGAEKDGQLSSDELARSEKDLDKVTQDAEKLVDDALSSKEAELMEV